MHVKRSMPKADRRRLIASNSMSDFDVVAPEDFSDDNRLLSSLAMRKMKHKNETSAPAKNKQGNGRHEASEPLFEASDPLFEASEPLFEDAHEVELQLLAIETRRLDFEVAQWKQQQMLRREALQLKREEIKLKEVTTKQQQHTHVMELKTGILQALDQVGQPPAQARKYLALLEG
ncbi:unnamed protein product [Peronospora farinosa]|uniref:Uncharacterized protein n=1 Tax=Peronospora farinosa TaxID=134698 RepID=A0ABN8C8F9_9STRA|nr:unnamed protein product [Peronospora farinosa]